MKTPYTLEQDIDYVKGMMKVWSKELKSIIEEVPQSTLATIRLKRISKELIEAEQLLDKDRIHDKDSSTISKV